MGIMVEKEVKEVEVKTELSVCCSPSNEETAELVHSHSHISKLHRLLKIKLGEY